MTGDLFGMLNRRGLSIGESPVSAANLGKLLDLIADGTISGRIAKDLFVAMEETGKDPGTLVEERGLKQVSDTVLSPNGQAFRKALLVQYPRAGAWTIAFQTGSPAEEIRARVPGDMVSVYVPTTPNPTSGFFLMIPRSEVIELGMSVDEALKYVVSMGVVAPARRPASHPPVQAPAAAAAPDDPSRA